MNRRDFSALLPILLAAPCLSPAVEARADELQSAGSPAPLSKLTSGEYVAQPVRGKQPSPRTSHHFILGMLPDNIRLEAHVTDLAPSAPPEPIGHHKHSEIWYIREGTAALMTNGVTRMLKTGDMGLCVAGDEHSITNASKTEPASYFVIAVGPPE